MKRSRAYDDLVALAEEAEVRRSDACCALLRGWEPFLAPAARLQRFKRSRAGCDDTQFAMDLADETTGDDDDAAASGCSSASSSTLSLSSIDDEDDLPLRRNSRENILLRQQQHKQQQMQRQQPSPARRSEPADCDSDAVLGAPETPEARVLRAGFARGDALFMDPLDKRAPFDVAAFLVLSISPQR